MNILHYILASDNLMATDDGLSKVAALLERLGPAVGEPLGRDTPWQPRDPLVEKLFAKEIFGIVSERKRSLSEELNGDIKRPPPVAGPVEFDQVDSSPDLNAGKHFTAPGFP